MAILNITIGQTGQDGQRPNWILIDTDDTLATVITPGYLNKAKQQGYALSEYQMALVSTKTSPSSTDVQLVELQVSYTDPNWSLVSPSGPGTVVLPTIANHIATYTNTTGALSEDAATAINGGNIQAGLSGTAGYFASFPATAARGSLRLVAANNAGDTVTQITNASFGQASVLTIPDPGGATANFSIAPAALVSGNLISANGTAGLIQDSGITAADVQLSSNIIAGKSADIGGAGAGPINVPVVGLTAASVVIATIESSTNAVGVASAAAGTDEFAITFTGDPGAACIVNYVAFIAPQ